MKPFLTLALAAALSGPAFAAAGDTVITKAKHDDAVSMMGQQQPAKDSTEVTWIGKDRMRIEDGEDVTIVRADLKKMYKLDMGAKTVSTIDLPFDMKKYMPAEVAPMMEHMMGQMKVTVTPTTETKKIKDWNATRYTMTMSMPMGGSMTQEIWATQDVAIDAASMQEMQTAFLSAMPMVGATMASEMKKVVGLPVLSERTMVMMGNESKGREEVTSIEQKEAPAGLYEVPAGFTEKPFDPMGEGGGMGPKMGRGHGPRGG
ncbi:MAG: DUF4412 domain-containing protein [Planctomycetes bacterium]|nr:DUF4412 domain-containing protein [Planctomycetota bacterium]